MIDVEIVCLWVVCEDLASGKLLYDYINLWLVDG